MIRIPHCLDNRLTDGGKVVRARGSLVVKALCHKPEGFTDEENF
jgi:hypothetical protein